MALQRITIADYQAWGNLVKTWATGVDHINNGSSYPRPQSLAELVAQCAACNVGLTVPARIPSLTLVQGDENTLVVKLPAKAMVLDSETELAKPGTTYSLPSFYQRVFQNVAPNVPQA